MFQHLIVRLSQKENYAQTYDLKFKLENHPFMTKWIDRYLAAQQRQDVISEPWAFYNLNNDWTDDKIIEFINYHIDICNSYVPNMFDKKLTNIQDQDTLNYIHSIFELHHGQVDAWLSNPLFDQHSKELRESLSHINQTVHRAESHNTRSYIRVVYFDLPKDYVFTEEDYGMFTDSIEFGGVYTLYADVGKNLESLSRDQDDHHHDFVPNLHYSVDFVIRFFDLTEQEVLERKKLYEQFFHNKRDYFESKGYVWGDPKLTTGAIKLAQLIYTDKQQVLEQVKQYNNIQSVFLI